MSKRTRQRCRDHAMHGMAVCYHHGGVTTIRGTQNPQYRHGRYSKVLPVRLAQHYEEAVQSPRLLSLSHDLAVLEARLADLFQRVDSGESGALWQQLKRTLDAFSVAMGAGDVPTMNRHFATMLELVQRGTADHAAWSEIQSLWETRAKLTQTEMKTLQTMQQMVSTEQLMVYMGALTDGIQRAVTAHAAPDAARAILAAISADFIRLGAGAGGPAAESAPA